MADGGDDDDATCSWFSRFKSVSLKRLRDFGIVSFEKNCLEQCIDPNRDAHFNACPHRMEISTGCTYSIKDLGTVRLLYLALSIIFAF